MFSEIKSFRRTETDCGYYGKLSDMGGGREGAGQF